MKQKTPFDTTKEYKKIIIEGEGIKFLDMNNYILKAEVEKSIQEIAQSYVNFLDMNNYNYILKSITSINIKPTNEELLVREFIRDLMKLKSRLFRDEK